MEQANLKVLAHLFEPNSGETAGQNLVWLRHPQSSSSLAEVIAGSPGARLSIIFELATDSRPKHVFRLLTLRARLWSSRQLLRRSGQQDIRAFAIYPSIDDPFAIYEIGSQSQVYAESNVILVSSRNSLYRRILRFIAGVEPAVSAVVLAGVRNAT